MPSARIKTLAVEEAHSLAEDLRVRGFVVEIVPLDKVSSDPVDLEVSLEECAPEAALERAESMPDALDVCVFVAPGALTEGQRAMKVIPLFAEPVKKVAPVVAMAPRVEEKLEDGAEWEEAEKLTASELEPPATVAEAAAAPAAPEIPPKVEVPVISPEVWNVAAMEEAVAAKVAPQKRRHLAGLKRLVANEKLLMRVATVGAMGAVAAVSVLVLGSSVKTFPSDAQQPASSAMVLPATASAAPKEVEPNPTAVAAPEPVRPKIVKKAHNPEEDIVAKDFTIRFNKPRVKNRAKKIAGVKHYSDLQ